jgi:hypothetical protein
MSSLPRFWSIDLAAGVASHVSGFSARVKPMPMTDADMRALHAAGLVAIATVRADDGTKWAVLADDEAVTTASVWIAKGPNATSPDLAIARLAREAGEAWTVASAAGISSDIN